MTYFKTAEQLIKHFEEEANEELRMTEADRKEIYKLLGRKYPGP
ncbi:hypothetical protein FACS1894218_4160 [Bacilli bacterium]|nr:hypothetical protein FACS1894218_4160 [Bacilli bacterium]